MAGKKDKKSKLMCLDYNDSAAQSVYTRGKRTNKNAQLK